MLRQSMILRKTAKDPETFATVQGFILSDQLRDIIGSTLASLVAKAIGKRNQRVGNVSIRDAFLTASMAAVLETSPVSRSADEMASCANIIFALLPICRLEEEGLANGSPGLSRATYRTLRNSKNCLDFDRTRISNWV